MVKKESLAQKIDRLERLIISLQSEIQSLRFQQPVYPQYPQPYQPPYYPNYTVMPQPIWYGTEYGMGTSSNSKLISTTTASGKSQGWYEEETKEAIKSKIRWW